MKGIDKLVYSLRCINLLHFLKIGITFDNFNYLKHPNSSYLIREINIDIQMNSTCIDQIEDTNNSIRGLLMRSSKYVSLYGPLQMN